MGKRSHQLFQRRMRMKMRLEDFFTNPTVMDIDFEKIRRDCERECQESLQREMEAWSELGGQVVGAEVPRSAFARQLAADPELAARGEKIVAALQKSAADDIAAGERAQRLTAKDFAVTINARLPIFR